MINGGRPPLPPPQRRSRPPHDAGYRGGRTENPHSRHKDGGGPRKTVVPPKNRVSASLHSSFRLFRSTAAPTTNVPGGRGGVPRGEISKRTVRGVEGASPSWGSGGKAPGSRERRWILIPPRISVVG